MRCLTALPLLLVSSLAQTQAQTQALPSLPNFLVFLVDDMGYSDLGCYGSKNNSSPNIDQLAAEGLRFTQWMSAASVCTPSRAALQTGRLARRFGMTANVLPWRLLITPSQSTGLPASERTVATELKELGYRTGMSGKWHLGVSNETTPWAHLPPRHGYDSWLGIPFTNMHNCQQGHETNYFCLMMGNTTVVRQPFKAQNLTSEHTRHALDFLQWSAEAAAPFFFIYNFMHVHTPLFASPPFAGISKAGGKFGDNVQEMDDAVGQVLAKLDELGLANDTLVLLTSDNGPYAEEGWENVGRSIGLKGSKGQTWEGGIRMPGIARWPGRIAAGTTTDALAGTIDIFPTIMAAVGAQPRTDRLYDGADLAPVLFATDPAAAPSVHDFMWHYCGDNVTAARHVVKTTAADGTVVGTVTLKLHFATQIWVSDERPTPLCVQCCPDGATSFNGTGGSLCDCKHLDHHDPPLIYSMDNDIGETTPITPESFPGGAAAFDAEVAAVKAALAAHYNTVAPAPDQMKSLPKAKLEPCCAGGSFNKERCVCDDYVPGMAYP